MELAEMIVDGSFRHGSDVLKGLAFDASLVGLGAGGEKGVFEIIIAIAVEFARLMTMVGIREPGQANRGILIEGAGC